ncbi:hypothetical protein DFH11DRAFT_913270 [Phellopilus nigrolimitatus]|nr:hypothetical protein DFH11DRAFT_913270 [Phellopilus nigrolimitatus]
MEYHLEGSAAARRGVVPMRLLCVISFFLLCIQRCPLWSSTRASRRLNGICTLFFVFKFWIVMSRWEAYKDRLKCTTPGMENGGVDRTPMRKTLRINAEGCLSPPVVQSLHSKRATPSAHPVTENSLNEVSRDPLYESTLMLLNPDSFASCPVQI